MSLCMALLDALECVEQRIGEGLDLLRRPRHCCSRSILKPMQGSPDAIGSNLVGSHAGIDS